MDINLVKKLREDTGLSIKDCTKAVKETESYDEAILYLRQRNKDLHDKRSGKETNHGTTAASVCGQTAELIILGCETDFVSGNEDFKKFAQEICESLYKTEYEEVFTDTIADTIAKMCGKFGENIRVVGRRTFTVADGEFIEMYNHGNIAVVVGGKSKVGVDDGLLRTVAMHIAASSPTPRSLTSADLDPDFLAQEKKLVEGSDDVQSKPENIRDKIVAGKMNKVYKTYCLLEQEMLTGGETKQTVGQWAEANNIVITGFELVSTK
jgi:elongation factor Ts